MSLDEASAGSETDLIQFHRIMSASVYVAVLYVDETCPAARHPAWYFSWLCVSICADAKANECDVPSLFFVSPDQGLLQRWWWEAEQCRKIGMARDISLTPAAARQLASDDWIKKCAREWTAPLRAAPERPAVLDARSRFEFEAAPRPVAKPQPAAVPIRRYYVFLASPNDLQAEREMVRRSFERFNRSAVRTHGIEFAVLDWEHYSHAGQGDPQTLIFKQVLDRYQQALVLFVGMFGSRFGQPTESHGSGTEAEFEWALDARRQNGWPEIMLFFKLQPLPADASLETVEQFSKVRAFREKVERGKLVLTKTFRDDTYHDVVENDLTNWIDRQLERALPSLDWSEQAPVR